MTNEPERQQNQDPEGRQPAINLPGVILALVGLLVAIHVARTFALNESGDLQLLLWLGFIPLRGLLPAEFDGGWLPLLWTPITHALLHANWEHLLFNSVWLAIFGTPVARRYGWLATLIVFGVSAVVGAAAFAATTLPDLHLMIGASGGVAGLTGAACRFMFQPVLVARHPETGEPIVLGRRLASLADLMTSQRTLVFILVWVGLNAAAPLLPILIGQESGIAWQAHLGGFLAGLLIVPLFERRPKETAE